MKYLTLILLLSLTACGVDDTVHKDPEQTHEQTAPREGSESHPDDADDDVRHPSDNTAAPETEPSSTESSHSDESASEATGSDSNDMGSSSESAPSIKSPVVFESLINSLTRVRGQSCVNHMYHYRAMTGQDDVWFIAWRKQDFNELTHHDFIAWEGPYSRNSNDPWYESMKLIVAVCDDAVPVDSASIVSRYHNGVSGVASSYSVYSDGWRVLYLNKDLPVRDMSYALAWTVWHYDRRFGHHLVWEDSEAYYQWFIRWN